MKKVYYEKKGRRYKPVAEYDSDLVDSFHKGTHLVMVYPGGTSRRYNIDPNYAALIAAGRVAEDAVSAAIMKATEIRRQQRYEKNTPLTPGQKAAWDKLIEEFGPDAKQLEWASVRECAEAGNQALQKEANMLLSNPTVRAAYDQFIMVCELSKDTVYKENK
jgi:hypothetical protein